MFNDQYLDIRWGDTIERTLAFTAPDRYTDTSADLVNVAARGQPRVFLASLTADVDFRNIPSDVELQYVRGIFYIGAGQSIQKRLVDIPMTATADGKQHGEITALLPAETIRSQFTWQVTYGLIGESRRIKCVTTIIVAPYFPYAISERRRDLDEHPFLATQSAPTRVAGL